MLTSSLNLINYLIIDYFISYFKRFILLVLFTIQKYVIHSKTPAIKLCYIVPCKYKLTACTNICNHRFWRCLFRDNDWSNRFDVHVMLLIFLFLRFLLIISKIQRLRLILIFYFIRSDIFLVAL